MKNLQIFILITSLFFIAGCSNSQKDTNTLTISTASSLTDAMKEIAETYEADHPVSIKLNLASSGKLARQIEQGAPVDLYLSANQYWMDELEKSGHIVPETRTDFISNSLVMVGKEGSPTVPGLTALTKNNRDIQIALGEPESVPAGTYTREALKTIHIWQNLKGQLVYASNVRQVLAYVESGNAEYGFVYESDAKISEKVNIIEKVDPSLYSPIVYPGAVVDSSQNKQAAESFLDFLQTETAQSIFKEYGFDTVKKVKDES